MPGFFASLPVWTVGYGVLLVAVSPICFTAYGLDKRRATRGQPRIPEKSLHLLELFGGWPGGLVGQQTFRHKTRKLSYQIVFWLIGCLHLTVVAAACYAWLS